MAGIRTPALGFLALLLLGLAPSADAHDGRYNEKVILVDPLGDSGFDGTDIVVVTAAQEASGSLWLELELAHDPADDPFLPAALAADGRWVWYEVCFKVDGPSVGAAIRDDIHCIDGMYRDHAIQGANRDFEGDRIQRQISLTDLAITKAADHAITDVNARAVIVFCGADSYCLANTGVGTSIGVRPETTMDEGVGIHYNLQQPPSDDGMPHGEAVSMETEPTPASRPTTPEPGIPAVAGPWYAVTFALISGLALRFGRMRIFDLLAFFPLFALFSRLQGNEVLKNDRRALLQNLIEEEPGIRFSELRRAIATGAGTVLHHLRTMEREGLVFAKRSSSATHYFPAGTPAVAPVHPVQQLLLETLQARPGQRQAQLARTVGAHRKNVAYHLRQMLDDGRINAQSRAGSISYWAASSGKNSIVQS